MAVFTQLSLADARRVAEAHGLGTVAAVVPIAAGSVNSNFFVDCDRGRWFVRIYEEQDADGVAYEWQLLDHLDRAGIPVPRRVQGPSPGVVRVEGKPVAVFELVHGRESCQKAVTPDRARAVGSILAQCHRVCADFGVHREGRFRLADVGARLAGIEVGADAEVAAARARLLEVVGEVQSGWPTSLPGGVIHGDLFRDNVRWEGDRIVAVIDWESASDGILIYDLMVCVLAWCYGSRFEWALARAMVRGYAAVRPLDEREALALRVVGMGAAARFATTRITDFELRQGAIGERTHKDYRRFMARLEAISAMTPDELAHKLL